ncbi:DUF4190 domain-containing protein [Streptomyces syringium]|uniref:DUF4190 domain-containing protein n=1 Tax=Streptomyces syringium TaxID=76729 RepID=UPI003454C2C6
MTQRAMFPPHQSLPTPPNGRDAAGTAALVLALSSLALTSVVGAFLLVIPVGFAAIVCGVVGVRRAKRGEASNGRMALVGLVLGAAITVPTTCFLMWLLTGLYGAYV